MNPIKQDRKPGISFIIPCRNEEKYIHDCITSLKHITIPHEIIVILHKCTDNSKSIVQELQASGYPIHIVEYEQEVSKAGYQTLVTAANHSLSFISYTNYCVSFANFNWLMKWGADFFCTDELTAYINQLDIGSNKPTGIRIGCKLGDSGIINKEVYISNAIVGYKKYIFWDVAVYVPGYTEINTDDVFIKSITPDIIKDHWGDAPWFYKKDTYDAGLVSKYEKLTEICGPEPKGVARASNKDFDKIWPVIMQNEERLKQYGILFYE